MFYCQLNFASLVFIIQHSMIRFSDINPDQRKIYLKLFSQFHSYWSYHDLKFFFSHMSDLLHAKREELPDISKANLVLVIVARYLRWQILSITGRFMLYLFFFTWFVYVIHSRAPDFLTSYWSVFFSFFLSEKLSK